MLATVAALALVLQGNILSYCLAMGFTFYVAIPSIIFACVMILRKKNTAAHLRLLKWMLLASAVFWSGLYLGRPIGDRRLDAAKAYPAQIQPVLEDFRAQNGVYPETLKDLPEISPPPYGLRYKGRGESYEMLLNDQRRVFGCWYFNSSNCKWNYD